MKSPDSIPASDTTLIDEYFETWRAHAVHSPMPRKRLFPALSTEEENRIGELTGFLVFRALMSSEWKELKDLYNKAENQ